MNQSTRSCSCECHITGKLKQFHCDKCCPNCKSPTTEEKICNCHCHIPEISLLRSGEQNCTKCPNECEHCKSPSPQVSEEVKSVNIKSEDRGVEEIPSIVTPLSSVEEILRNRVVDITDEYRGTIRKDGYQVYLGYPNQLIKELSNLLATERQNWEKERVIRNAAEMAAVKSNFEQQKLVIRYDERQRLLELISNYLETKSSTDWQLQTQYGQKLIDEILKLFKSSQENQDK